jgi:hypothetical protein
LDLGKLIIVGEDHRIALFGELFDAFCPVGHTFKLSARCHSHDVVSPAVRVATRHRGRRNSR